MTLYMKLGGRAAMLRAMTQLKDRLEEDPCFDLASFQKEFDTSDDLQEFLVFLFGGAPVYEGKPVRDLLSPLCSCHDVYERFVDHLVSVFIKGSTIPGSEDDLRQLMERLRPHVLDPKPVKPTLVYSVETDQISA